VSQKFEFEMAWPKLLLYRAADRRLLQVGLNRYPGVIIGAFVHVGWRVLGLTWGRPGVSDDPQPDPDAATQTDKAGT
jgi:hypothetical protein